MESLVTLTIICAASILLAATHAIQNGDLRLAGHGASRFAGRLEIYYEGEWGTVCTSGDSTNADFHLQAGAVACRQMGLGNVVDLYTKHYFPELRFRYGEGTGPIFLDRVQCSGHESHLLRCTLSVPFGTVSESCSHDTEVALVCSNVSTPYEGEVRLRPLNPSIPEQGVVELYSSAQWAPVCYSENTAGQVANVTCKQLGYTHAVNFRPQTISGSHWDVQTVQTPSCSGTETCIKDCLPSLPVAMATGGCTAMLLQCGLNTALLSSVPSGNRQSCRGESTVYEGAVRVKCSDDQCSSGPPCGVVEVFANGSWGLVCYNGATTIQDADVVCKQLGYPSAISVAFDLYRGSTDNGSANYLLDCSGLESTIKDCTVTESNNQCSHFFMKVMCSSDIPPYGSLTLRDSSGASGSRGTLLVHTAEHFNPVCESDFDETHGEVACRQLGYNSLVAIHRATSYVATPYSDKQDSLLFPEGSCTEDTRHLISCLSPTPPTSSSTAPGCRETVNEVVLSCHGGGPEEMNVRLVGVDQEDSPISGRLEVYIQNRWGSVCAVNSVGERVFGYLEASVVCRSIGFQGAAREPYPLQRIDGSENHLNSVVCSGFEESIFDCRRELGGDNCSVIVGIECSNSLDVSDGELRLHGSQSISNETAALGRLEISYHGVWMTVCGTYFSDEAAQVACRQLGYTTVVDVCRNSSCYGQGEGYIHVAEDMCSGEERRLLDCNREPFPSQFCDHSLDVGLQCARSIAETITTTSATSATPTPTAFPLYIIIIIAVSAFVVVLGFVIAVCCCACCVHKQKKGKEEGTWISPNQRNGRAAFSSGSSSATPNAYVQTTIRNNLHASDDKLSGKAQDHFDDPSDIIQEREVEPKIIDTASKQPHSTTMTSKRDSSYSSSPSHSGEPSSPVAKVMVSTRRTQHHYQNVIETRSAVEEPPPNYDELDDLPPVHDVHYRAVPNSVSFSAVNAMADQDDLGEGSAFAVRTMDSGIGSTTNEVDIKHDLQLPPLSPHDHETML